MGGRRKMMSDAIFLTKRASGYLKIGDKREIDKLRGESFARDQAYADFALHSRRTVSRQVARVRHLAAQSGFQCSLSDFEGGLP